jgi:2-dehydropantoate 2-reductase
MTSVVVVGAGAIGAWLADALATAGWSTSLVARGRTLEVLRRDGLRLDSVHGTRLTRPRAGSPEELGIHDYLLLAVKAQALSELAPGLAPLIGPDTCVVSATNGIPWWFFQGFDGPLKDRRLRCVDPDGSQEATFPLKRTLGSVVHASVRVLAPGHAEVVGADRWLVGEPSGINGERTQRLVAAARAGGIPGHATDGIRRDVWIKLWGNMNMNPVSALTRSGTGRMLADPDVRELCMAMMQEMRFCADRLGLNVGISVAERMAVTQRLGDFKTSMLADLEAGRPLEWEPQLGAVAEIAELLAVPAPVIRGVLGLTRCLAGA